VTVEGGHGDHGYYLDPISSAVNHLKHSAGPAMVLAEPVSGDCAVLEQRLVAVDGWGAGGTACTEVTDDEPALTTVRGRLTAAGLSEGRIEQHMTAGRLRVDGEPVTDRDAPAPAGTQ
jgi:hypothetical protein